MTARLRALLTGASELAAFGVAAVVMTWPLAAHLRDRVPNIGDPLLTSWVLPWVVRALGTQPFELFGANIFHPEPNTLAYMDHMLAAVPLAAPVWLLTGDGILVNNLTVVLLVALGGWAAYRLALDLTGSRWASAVAGTIFAFSPYTFAHLSHTNLLITYAMPPAWLFARRVVVDARTRDAVGLTVFWLLSALSSWYYAVFVSLSLAALVGAEVLVRRRRVRWRRVAVLLGCAAAVVVAVAFVLSRPYVEVQERYPQAARTIEEAESYSSTPKSLLAPPPGNTLYGDALARFRQPSGFNEVTLFPGLVPTALAAAALVGAVRRRRVAEVVPWLAAGGVMFVLAFGPFLSIGSYRIRLPFFFLYRGVEALRFIRNPGRAGILVMLAVGILAALALARISDPKRRAALCAVAVVVIGVEYSHVPVETSEAPRPSRVHEVLAASDVEGAVVALPTVEVREGELVSELQAREARYVAFSAEHWRPLLNGYSGFFPPTFEEMARAVQDFPSPSSLDFLRGRGTVFVTVHLDQLSGSVWEHLQDGVDSPSLELVLDDGKVRLYRLLP